MAAPAQPPRNRPSRWWWVLAALVVLGLLYGRALFEAKGALEAGDALATTDPVAAVLEWRHAVEWYAPFNPWSTEAVARLEGVGMVEATTPEEAARALRALESLRTAILLARGVTTPYGDHLGRVEARIAAYRGAEAAARTGEPLEAEVARQARLLRESRERAPDPLWSLATTLSFALWLLVTWRGLRRSTGPDGRLRGRRALLYAGASGLLLAAWIVGLTLV